MGLGTGFLCPSNGEKACPGVFRVKLGVYPWPTYAGVIELRDGGDEADIRVWTHWSRAAVF